MMPTPTSPLTGTESGLAAGAPGATREAMVARLEAAGQLRPGPVREALLALRREVLIPQAYVRRSDPGVQPPRWDFLVAAEGRELDMGTAMKAPPRTATRHASPAPRHHRGGEGEPAVLTIVLTMPDSSRIGLNGGIFRSETGTGR